MTRQDVVGCIVACLSILALVIGIYTYTPKQFPYANRVGAADCKVYQAVEIPESTESVAYHVRDYADGYNHLVYTTRYHAAHIDTVCIERRK